jgi:hypothetical protein
MTVQFALESVSSLPWNHCPDSRGISVQFGLEYALDGICQRVQGAICDPGMRGCVLEGKVRFASEDSNAKRKPVKAAATATRPEQKARDTSPPTAPTSSRCRSPAAILGTRSKARRLLSLGRIE